MKKYKLQKQSMTKVIADDFSETLKSFGYFVSCGSLTGITYGIVRNFELESQALGVVEDNGEIAPLLFLGLTALAAKNLYSNFKAEKSRYLELAKQIEAEKKAQEEQKKALKEQRKVENKEFAEFLNKYSSQEETPEGGKRINFTN